MAVKKPKPSMAPIPRPGQDTPPKKLMDAQDQSKGDSRRGRRRKAKVAYSVRLPKDLLDAANEYADEHEVTVTELIEEGLRSRLKRK